MKVPELFYSSPVIRYDPLAQVEVFERRDKTTGTVSFQEPSPEEIKRIEESSGSSAAAPSAPRISLLV
jgi:hypothetical protein